VTAGYQHLKFWHLDPETKMPVPKVDEAKKVSILSSESADLAKVKCQVFVGLCIGEVAGEPKVFTLTTDGHIYLFSKLGVLEKWMNIKVERAFSCSTTDGKLFCACSDGVIRVFDTANMKHLLTLPKPPPLGLTNVESGEQQVKLETKGKTQFADTIACVLD
jgi:hypothetical protein